MVELVRVDSTGSAGLEGVRSGELVFSGAETEVTSGSVGEESAEVVMMSGGGGMEEE